jgi:protein SCO1/2
MKGMSKASRQLLLIFLALGLGLALFAGLALRNFEGEAVAAIGGPFAMTAQDGRTVTNADLAGRPYLVFFGYTHCPDFCPTTLTQISAVFREMGPDKKIAALFVTIDPQRDSPETMKAYLENFDSRIIGLMGNDSQTYAIAKAFKVYFKKQGADDGNYTVDHTGVVYLMDKNGRFVGGFNLDQPAKQAAAELIQYL